MDKLAEFLGRLERLNCLSNFPFDSAATAITAAIRPSGREAHESYQSRIWRYEINGGGQYGPNGDYLLRCSPVDGCLAFASDRTIRGKADLFLLEGDVVRPLGSLRGTIEDLRWTNDGRAIIALAADRGLDKAAISGAVRLRWGKEDDPAVLDPNVARRPLFKVSASDGTTVEIGPHDRTVWEFDLLGDEGSVALISADSSERGWYHAKLAAIDRRTRVAKILHESAWQLQRVAASPAGRRIAFLEGWSSDRGMLAGEMRILDLAACKVQSIAAAEQSSICSLSWRDEESLWYAGWSGLGSVYGVVRLDGTFEWITREDAVIGANSFVASMSPPPDKTGFAAVRETVANPSEIVFKASPESEWVSLTSLNATVMADCADYPEVREVHWRGKDGRALEGLLLLPKDRKSRPQPMIVDIHGGATWSIKYSFNPGFTLVTSMMGYAVFLPNYRGNTGWGQRFSQLNIGDPGGAEFDDIMAGIDPCIAEGMADHNRLGVTGVSYGVYMTAWAVACINRFKAAVMVSGIANHWNCHYSCNYDFGEFIIGGPLKNGHYRKLAIDLSPLFRLENPTTPILIVHGELDRCRPLGQGQEIYSALLEWGVPAELVIYPREGHELHESNPRLDEARRVTQWFDRCLRAA